MDRRSHWDDVYRTKGPEQVSWFQAEARLSRALIERSAPDRSARIVDVGAGASLLTTALLQAGYHHLTIVDLSAAALALAQERLGSAATAVTWRVGDVLDLDFAPAAFDVWHDRAVFHFLTQPEERMRYVAQVRHAVAPGGHVLVATFAEDGPLRCSGLEVARYSPTALHHQFGQDFELIASEREIHTTPAGTQQAFTYCLCRFAPTEASRAAA
jgi:2-polyprenyl-3-methyl-5-hydroxy-6-metoxy-1,4-benzoquinol methylase